jgi:methionine-S-sulfoxide reductase
MAEQRIILASGCFWGAQDILRKIPGVIRTEVGYAGGTFPNPQYKDVRTGQTGHAESVDLYFDPTQIQLGQILDVFFRMHNPTTEDQQGNDIGNQYRSAIFYLSDEQNEIALQKIMEIEKAGFWKGPVVTEVVPFNSYFKAEEYHQDYLIKNPNGYSCHFLREF